MEAVPVLYAVGAGLACVAAIGIIAYAIYKTVEYNHDEESKKKKSVEIKLLITTNDIKAPNTKLRQRRRIPVVESGDQPSSRNCESTRTTVPPQKEELQGTETVDVTNQTNSHQETQTADLVACNISSNVAETQTDLLNPLTDQDSQTTDSLINGGNNLNIRPGGLVPGNLRGLFINPLNDQTSQTDSIGGSSVDMSESDNLLSDETESTYSMITNCTISSDTHYPTWDEMSSDERDGCLCKICGKKVETITYPCRHSYFCGECAVILFKLYNHRCPKCKKRIKSFDNVNN